MDRPEPNATSSAQALTSDAPTEAAEAVRLRLLDAAGTCIIRRGDAHVRMGEVARQAGVARSTLYRYFASRSDLVLGLLVHRARAALDRVVAQLDDPEDAAVSIPDLVLFPIGLVEGNPLNEALFSPESEGYITILELGSEALVETALVGYGPLFEQWQRTGQLHADLDIRETVRWLNAVALVLLAAPWRGRSTQEKRVFMERYVVRALVVGAPQEPG